MGDLTADEMWTTLLVCSVTGPVAGIPAAILTLVWALIIAGAMVGGALGLDVASRILRRMKRGRPDTWLYHQMQLAIARHIPTWNSARLITHSEAWTCRRTETP